MSRIALLIPTVDRIGGAERQVILLAMRLSQRGHGVTVVALSGTGGASACQLRSAGVDFVSLAMRKGLADPRGWLRWGQWLWKHRPDIVHAHLPHAVWMARWSRIFGPGAVVIDTIHTSAIGTFGRRFGYRISRSLPDLVTAVSQSVRDNYVAEGMVQADQVRVVPNGIDVPGDFDWPARKREARRELGIEGGFVWLAIGRLEVVKNYPLMLEALALLPESATLVIAGTGPLAMDLQQLAEQMQISRRVRFLGFVEDLGPWLHAADACVSTSLWEGLPMALLEAAAFGLPAVATDVCGNRDVVVEGETGWLASIDDPIGFSRCMSECMESSDEERLRVSEAARRKAIEEYDLDVVCRQWEAVYEQLMQVKRSSRLKAECATKSSVRP